MTSRPRPVRVSPAWSSAPAQTNWQRCEPSYPNSPAVSGSANRPDTHFEGVGCEGMGVTVLAGLPVVWSEDCLRHEPDGEVWLGVWEAGTEVPERASVVLAAVTGAGGRVTPAVPHSDDALLAVHDAELIEHLSTIWRRWEGGGYVAEHGRRRVVPYVFPAAGLLGGLPARLPAAVHAETGRFCYDTMTLAGPGSWGASRAAGGVALSGA